MVVAVGFKMQQAIIVWAEDNERKYMKKIMTLFLSAQPMISAGMQLFFLNDPHIKLNAKKIFNLNEEYNTHVTGFDVVIIDDDSPSNYKLQISDEILKEEYSITSLQKIKVAKKIIYTDSTEINRLKKIINSGVEGIVCKYSENERLREAIIRVNDGEKYYCDKIMSLIYSGTKYDTILTPREREVLYFIHSGLSYKEIAARLFISNYTLNRHIENIRSRLGVRSIKDLIKLKKI